MSASVPSEVLALCARCLFNDVVLLDSERPVGRAGRTVTGGPFFEKFAKSVYDVPLNTPR
jgi:hypothetical protein